MSIKAEIALYKLILNTKGIIANHRSTKVEALIQETYLHKVAPMINQTKPSRQD